MMNGNLLQQDRLCLEEIDQFINFNSILFLFGGEVVEQIKMVVL